MITKIERPSMVFIGNKSKSVKQFPLYGQNMNWSLQPGETILFKSNRLNELLFYRNLGDADLEVGLTSTDHVIKSGEYDVPTAVFTEGGTYSIVGNGTDYKVIGELPYEEADATLGLAEGNRFRVRISNDIPVGDLPAGKIIKITNTLKEGGYNEYTKAALEPDGSIVNIANFQLTKIFEIKVQWTEGVWTTYTFDRSLATLQAK